MTYSLKDVMNNPIGFTYNSDELLELSCFSVDGVVKIYAGKSIQWPYVEGEFIISRIELFGQHVSIYAKP